MTDDNIIDRLMGPHEWGYRCIAEGSFISDDAPFRAAEGLANLFSALQKIAAGEVEEPDEELGTVLVSMSGEEAAEIARNALAAISPVPTLQDEGSNR